MRRNKKTKIVWLSNNLFGYELLKEALKIKRLEIGGLIILSKKAKTKTYDGIDRNKWYNFGIPVYEIENINEETKLLKLLNPDFVIVSGWRQIINKEIFKIPKRDFIGFHPSLLPEGRGSAPIINTIIQGFRKSGLTMFYLNEGIDSGDIIGQIGFDVSKDDYALDIYYKVIKAGKILIKQFLPLLIKNKAPRISQDDKKATYFPKRNLRDNEIKIDQESPEMIYRKIRAFSKPYNGAYIKVKNKRIVIQKAELRRENKNNFK